MSKPKKERINITLDPEVIKETKIAAIHRGKSASEFIQDLLERELRGAVNDQSIAA